MKTTKSFENYPAWIVFIANLVLLAIYLIGALIIIKIGLIWLIIYLLYILFLETKLLKRSCVNCYYYGRYCAFGKGKISSWFFRKGNPSLFCNRKITWKNILPDFLVAAIPLLIGIVLLILDFNWPLLILMILLILLTSAGNSFVRGHLACKFCRQKELGCPAEKLFNKS